MASDHITIEDKDIDIKKTLQEIEQMKPSVCFLWNKNEIEIVSDNYTDLLEAKVLIQQKMPGKTSRRAMRTFSKALKY